MIRSQQSSDKVIRFAGSYHSVDSYFGFIDISIASTVN
jgi:hypothetical protein